MLTPQPLGWYQVINSVGASVIVIDADSRNPVSFVDISAAASHAAAQC